MRGTRAAVLGKVREYRWELWLLVGIPLVAETTDTLSVYLSYGRLFGFNSVETILSLAILACSYLWVRRLERPLLRLVWLYALAVAVVKLSGVLLLLAWVEDIIGPQGREVVWWILVWVSASLLILLLVLVALARMASRRGFDKALALITISALPGVGFTVNLAVIFFLASGIGYGTPALLGWYLFMFAPTLVVAWALKRGDAGVQIPKRGLAALFGVVCVSSIVLYALHIDWKFGLDREGLVASLSALAVYYAIAIGAAYLVREESSGGGPAPEVPSTMLYGGRWRAP